MKLAEAKVFLFIRDIETKIYNVTDSPDFPKVPKELIIESIKYPEKIVAERIIRGRERIFNRYVFQTGIRPISTNTYYGDYYEFKNGKKVNSFILFQFESGGNILTVHFFNSFKLKKKGLY